MDRYTTWRAIKHDIKLTNLHFIFFPFEQTQKLVETALQDRGKSVVHEMGKRNSERYHVEVLIPFNRAGAWAEPVERLPVLPPVPELENWDIEMVC